MRTMIPWTVDTWNPIRGCSSVSEGCRNCYAAQLARRFCRPGQPFHGFVVPGERLPGQRREGGGVGPARWTGRVELVPARLRQALHDTRPRRVFVNSMSDLFHDALPFDVLDQVWAVMALTPTVTYQVLTKRPGRMRDYLSHHAAGGHSVWAAAQRLPLPRGRRLPDVPPAWPLKNVWLGVSAENQAMFDLRVPVLFDAPAALHFVSLEPLLGPVALAPVAFDLAARPLDWVIVGGESGPRARSCELHWIGQVVSQCLVAGVPVFVKQLGACASDPLNRIAGAALKLDPAAADGVRRLRHRAGADPSEWPEALRVRQFPGVPT